MKAKAVVTGVKQMHVRGCKERQKEEEDEGKKRIVPEALRTLIFTIDKDVDVTTVTRLIGCPRAAARVLVRVCVCVCVCPSKKCYYSEKKGKLFRYLSISGNDQIDAPLSLSHSFFLSLFLFLSLCL